MWLGRWGRTGKRSTGCWGGGGGKRLPRGEGQAAASSATPAWSQSHSRSSYQSIHLLSHHPPLYTQIQDKDVKCARGISTLFASKYGIEISGGQMLSGWKILLQFQRYIQISPWAHAKRRTLHCFVVSCKHCIMAVKFTLPFRHVQTTGLQAYQIQTS